MHSRLWEICDGLHRAGIGVTLLSTGLLLRRHAAEVARYSDDVVVRPDVHTRTGYLAGDDARRLQELNDAFADPSIKAIVAARGGYGATRIVRHLPAHTKWIVGFSDVTALHVEAIAHGTMSLHAPMLAWLGDANDEQRAEWLAAFERGEYGPWDVETVVAGNATGISFGGNLALLEACAAMGRLRVPAGAILFLCSSAASFVYGAALDADGGSMFR